MKMGKKYSDSLKLIDRTKQYDPEEAIALVKQTAKAKFDETVEISVRLGVDPRHADQQVRGAVVLPNGTGKKVTVLVIAKGDKAAEAEAAGADYVGAEEMIAKIQGGWFDFDVVVATPDMMGQVGRLGRVLGCLLYTSKRLLGTLNKNVYIHFDLDVLDPIEFSDTPLPVPDGLRFSDAMYFLKSLAQSHNIVGMGLYEYIGNVASNSVVAQLVRFGLGI